MIDHKAMTDFRTQYIEDSKLLQHLISARARQPYRLGSRAEPSIAEDLLTEYAMLIALQTRISATSDFDLKQFCRIYFSAVSAMSAVSDDKTGSLELQLIIIIRTDASRHPTCRAE
jgi:hypothetical protein